MAKQDSALLVEQQLAEIKKKKIQPIYFLCGEEEYYIDKLQDAIEANTLEESDRAFNQTILYGKDVDMGTIISEARRFPMMAERTLVSIREAQHLKLDGLELYLKSPNPSTVLVFAYKGKTVDKRTKLFKQISDAATVIECNKLYDDKLAGFITKLCQEKGYKIAPQAAVLLAEYLGDDLSKIDNEIGKLAINIKKGEEITVDAIQNNIGISKDFNVFELQNALAAKNVFKSNQIINYFASNIKAHPFVLIPSSLFGYFTKVMLVHRTADKSKLASALKVHPFFVKNYEAAARNYPANKLVEIISLLREYDLKSKGVNAGNISDGELMKEMIFKILH